MADIKVEAKRVRYGQSLQEMEDQGLEAIAVLQGVKTNIVALKNAVTADADFDAADIAAVQTVIDDLLVAIDTI